MTVIELTCQVNQSGRIVIPADAIADMMLKPGDTVHIAYISKGGKSNDYREFLLSETGIERLEDEESSFQIPTEFLIQAKIPPDSDLQIACFDGLIVICKAESLVLEDLNEILERMKKAREFADYFSFSSDLSDIKSQLADTIQYYEGGESIG